AGLERTERAPFAIARSYGFEYRYLPQDTRIGEGDVCRLAQNVDAEVTVAELDEKRRRVVLKISPAKLAKAGLGELPRRVCLIELEHRGTRVIEEAIQAIAERFAADGSLAPALRDLLLRRPPRIAGAAGGPIRRDGEPLEAAYLRA